MQPLLKKNPGSAPDIMPEPIANLKKENNQLNTQVLCIILVSLLNRFLLKMLGSMLFSSIYQYRSLRIVLVVL